MITWLCESIRRFFDHTPVNLAVVRRYTDANGSYIGELYKDGICIGASLDSFPLSATCLWDNERYYALDLAHDFLAPMAANRLRVGAAQPCDNDGVRDMIAGIPRRNIRVSIQNRFIEYVLEGKQTI